MDFGIVYLPSGVDEWTVTRCIADVLHSDEFAPRRHQKQGVVDRPVNFRVKLNPSKAGGIGNDGTGTLTLPTTEVANHFLKWVKQTPIKIEGKKVKFFRHGPAYKALALTLDKTPYINPDIEQERAQKLWDLQDLLRVDAVQFGLFYRPKYPSNDREPLCPRAFSIEWERNYETESIGWLSFEYDHKLIRIKLGNEMTEKKGCSIAITFASIQKIGVGYEGKPYICFDTLTPPIMEETEFYRALTGDDAVDNRKFKHRIGALHPGHEVVAPYAPHLRVVLYNDLNVDMVNKFVAMCQTAGLATSKLILRCQGSTQIDAHRRGFFTPKRLYELCGILTKFPWSVAFQLEALLHNRLLHTEEVFDLLNRVRSLCERHGDTYVGDLLRTFNEALQVRPIRESPSTCFERVLQKFHFLASTSSDEIFRCYHITFTPTRLVLEGPYATQSNRIIRQYQGYEDHFIRVDFRDEDRLQYRWDREVDGSSFVHQRVGGLLKGGFELAGRQFEFLAYSTSALREHAVWFMNPFQHPEKGQVTSKSIRDAIGDFSGSTLLKHPSKYAARLAQAFTATVSSVKIWPDQWEQVDDLGKEPYQFTDGVGTISQTLGDKIWAALCAERRDNRRNSVKPSAYQIRFLGFKGVVGVDTHLDGHPNGILMRLRGSMNKFESKQEGEADIEIAQAFERPMTCYLNRPLIMVLEDLGVRQEVFMELQEAAVADARTIDDSGDQFCKILHAHSLGRPYRVSYLIKKIEELGLTLKPGNHSPSYDTPFLRHVRQVAMTDVLRDIKHSARIPIPDSFLLVGVADEGPAYMNAGHSNVYVLPEGHIFACVQRSPDLEPVWLEGSCSISRSPVAHPGDVQRVRAIGKPPEGMMCLFAHMKNCVVFPSVGDRSLASCLGGGDLDGDLFSVIRHGPLLPSQVENAALYDPGSILTVDWDSTVHDICDFVVNYINSDVLGLLSDRLLVIADQSKEGILDKDCLWLAELCSQAVDFPKQGIPVDIDNNRLPRTLIRCKPDWHAAEVISPRNTDYYESSRALGVLYRSISLDDPQTIPTDGASPVATLTDPISLRLKTYIQHYLQPYTDPDGRSPDTMRLFGIYVEELRYICATHTLTDAPEVRLLEAEVVAGTILAKCSQKRWRKDRKHRMSRHASTLVRDIRRNIMEDIEKAPEEELFIGLAKAWDAWEFSLRRKNDFGGHSFGLIALGVIFDCLDKLPAVSL
ncbi:RNA dependent RNA polymerase-domain-containing protein [Collybia nuda]|uniref:RNA-dependent RNA polymerase n=1 Tax=Collybia nuda TaxID=64659 RepID=A0A9P6CK67_9AGAR|nr:RNA dependent RNA polymerase-domain-containing protein [Collybia nuda]